MVVRIEQWAICLLPIFILTTIRPLMLLYVPFKQIAYKGHLATLETLANLKIMCILTHQ